MSKDELDVGIVAETVQKVLGVSRYQANVMRIAEILSELDPRTDPNFKGEGINAFAAKLIIQDIKGGRKISPRTDPLTQMSTGSIEDLSVRHQEATAQGIPEFISFGAGKQDKQYSVKDKLSRIETIRVKLLADTSLHLTKMTSGFGGETANDWLSDVIGRHSADQDSEFIRAKIEEIRKLSRANVKLMSAMQKIRDAGITVQDLRAKSSREIFDTYGFGETYDMQCNSTFRVNLLRLRGEVGI